MAEYKDELPINFDTDYDKAKIDNRVAKRTKAVREKMYGLDVRESIAQAAEISSVVSTEAKVLATDAESRQTDFEERYDAQIAGNTNLNEVIDARKPNNKAPFITLGKRLDENDIERQALKNEVVAARNSYPNLNDRLVVEKEQLETKIEDNARALYLPNSKGYMTLPVYNNADDYQATHPSVLHIDGGWNGFEYWMGMTPYEKSNEWLENPSVLCSHDGLTWQVPPGGGNPLASTNNANDMYHSDTHLVMADNQLECWYRRTYRGSESPKEQILRRTTLDGATWTSEEIMYERLGTGADLLCPVVHFVNGKYKLWVFNHNNEEFEYFESNQNGVLTKVRDIQPPAHPKGLLPWHMDVVEKNGEYELFYCASYRNNDEHPTDRPVEMCVATSSDNVNYIYEATLMVNDPMNFDSSRLYRPSIVDVGNKRRMYYSGSTETDDWYIGLTVANLSDKNTYRGVSFTNLKEVNGTKASHYVFPNGLKTNELQVGKHAKLTETELKLVSPGNLDMRWVLDPITKKMALKNYVNDQAEIGKMLIHQLHLWDDVLDTDTRYFAIKNEKPIYFDGNYQQHLSIDLFGQTAERPVGAYSGQTYFDSNLGKPLWWHNDNWVDANGNIS